MVKRESSGIEQPNNSRTDEFRLDTEREGTLRSTVSAANALVTRYCYPIGQFTDSITDYNLSIKEVRYIGERIGGKLEKLFERQ